MENINEELTTCNLKDEESINECISVAHRISELETGWKNDVDRVYPGLQAIPPLGIYYNNKIIEVYRYVRNNGLFFSKSFCVKAIDAYFTKLVTDAIELAQQFLSENIKSQNELISKLESLSVRLDKLKNPGIIERFTKNKYKKIIADYNGVKGSISKPVYVELLDQYTDICNQILNFNLENDIDKALNYKLDCLTDAADDSNDFNSVVDEYNQELKIMGINKAIDYRQNIDAKRKVKIN